MIHVTDEQRSARPSFTLLSQPIRLAGLTVPNRIAMAAMSSVLATDDGTVTPETIAYYKERAEGGTGLITVEFTCVDTSLGRAELKQLALDDDRQIEGHRLIADAIKAAGSCAILQLHAPGQLTDRRTHEGLPAGPSAEVSRRDKSTTISRALSDGEIEALVDSFSASAARAVKAGYQGIELHGAHGYLLMAFLSPLKNRRDDDWGGDAERRLRFPAAVIRAVKLVLGPERPLIYRLSSTDFLPGGLSLEDMTAIAPKLVEAGVDVIHVSSGSIEGSLDQTIDPMSAPEAWRFSHCRAIRAAVNVPVIGVGPVRWPEVAERGLRDGDIDMVALGRPLLADPAWARKSLEGKVGDIRPCTNCNWCFDQILRHHPISCAENPRAGHELSTPPMAGGRGRIAIVVGGGPGGMAAALNLQEAEFQTTLYEAHNNLGGGLIASATPPLKDKLFWYLDYLRARIAESKIEIRLGSTVKAAEIVDARPHVVILATGALAQPPSIAGSDTGFVTSAYAILMGDAAPPPLTGHPVVIYGGGETGCETAEFLAQRGYHVILVTRSAASELARSAEPMYRKHLRARLKANSAITIREKSTILLAGDGLVHLTTATGPHHIEASGLVMAQGRSTGTDLEEPLLRAGIPFAMVGDVHIIGRIGDAVHAARRAVHALCAQPMSDPTGVIT